MGKSKASARRASHGRSQVRVEEAQKKSSNTAEESDKSPLNTLTTSSQLGYRKYVSSISRNVRAEAPYNFVALSEKVVFADAPDQISQDRPFADGLCGVIRFCVIAETDLCVGGTRTKAGDAPGKVEFLTTPDKDLAIGGSSLRGLFRNVVEIATFGKFRLITGDRRFAMRELAGANKEFYVGSLSEKIDPKASGGVQPCFRPKSRAGWMHFDDVRSTWVVKPSEFARIEQDQLFSVTEAAQRSRFRNGDQPDPKRRDSASATEKYLFWSSLHRPVRGTASIARESSVWHQAKDGKIFYTLERIATAFQSLNSEEDDSDLNRRAGSLVFTGQVSAKHKEFFFFNEKESLLDVDADVFRRFIEVQREKVTRAIGDGHAAQTHWQYLKDRLDRTGEPIPIFYLVDEATQKIKHIGLSMMFPLPYDNSIGDLADRQRGRTRPEPDWAEAIFGTIGEDAADDQRPEHERGLKGRVSFSLARVVGGSSVKTQPALPGILGEPKPSFYPSYIEQDDKNRGNNYMKARAEAKLRGWKRYPVRAAPAQTADMGELARKTRLQTVLNAVPRETRFEAKLRFHNLRPFELGAVLWAMTFGDADGTGPHRHALGTGKPWGFGRVRLVLNTEDWNKAIRPNQDGAPVPSPEALIAAFETGMERHTRSLALGPWRTSRQITELLAMADPANAEDNRNAGAGYLQTMPLPIHGDVKEQRAYLGRYKGRSSS